MKKSGLLKLFTVVLSAFLLLAACSSGGEKASGGEGKSKKDVKLAFIPKLTGVGFFHLWGRRR